MSKIGEVIGASTAELIAQCYELHNAPPLGGLVKTTELSLEIYAIVGNAETHSIEAGRRPIPRGEAEDKEEDIFSNNPQLIQLLCTDFTALVVGYRDGNVVYQYLPPRPARIHSFVYICSPEEVERFSQSLDFLGCLVAARLPGMTDELIAACLRQLSEAHPDPRAFLVRAGKELTLLLSGEIGRLNNILRRITR